MNSITKEEYEKALVRLEELLPLVGNNVSADDKNMIEFDMVSDIIERYENNNYPSYQPTLGEIIQEALYEYGYTVKQIAQKLGVSTRKVNDYINNRSEPTLTVARGLCNELHISPADVLGVS